MDDLLLSRFETYLLDDEQLFIGLCEEKVELVQLGDNKEYPQGFFTSL